METTIRIKSSELTNDFFEKIKILFKDEDEIEISFTSVPDYGLTQKENATEYEERINKAIRNLESRNNIVSITEKDLDSMIKGKDVKK